MANESTAAIHSQLSGFLTFIKVVILLTVFEGCDRGRFYLVGSLLVFGTPDAGSHLYQCRSTVSGSHGDISRRVFDVLDGERGESRLHAVGFLDRAEGNDLFPRNQERHHHVGPTFGARQVGGPFTEPDAGG